MSVALHGLSVALCALACHHPREQACAQRPCASAWLGVAAARDGMGDVAGTEAALAKAVALDAENPAVWGALARAAVRCVLSCSLPLWG